MPGYKGHIAGGSLLYALILYPLYYLVHPSFYHAAEWFFFLIAGALFPDIDTKSKGQYLFYYAVAALLLFLFINRCYELAAVCGILALIPLLVHHRGLFHETWFVIMLPLTIAGIATTCVPHYAAPIFIDAIFFIVGALSHLCLDRGIKRVFR
jgi:hypothetical protein